MTKRPTPSEQLATVERIREVNENARLAFDVEAFELAKKFAYRPRATRAAPTEWKGRTATVTLNDLGARIRVCIDLPLKAPLYVFATI